MTTVIDSYFAHYNDSVDKVQKMCQKWYWNRCDWTL